MTETEKQLWEYVGLENTSLLWRLKHGYDRHSRELMAMYLADHLPVKNFRSNEG